MLKIGISGIIGSGKSTVCKIFGLLGVPVYNADIEAKKLYRYTDVKRLVQKSFGDSIFDKDGNLIPANLAGIVFNDPEKLASINQIIHPLVKEDFQQWCNKHADHDYVLYESALFFESGFYKDYDMSIVVLAPEEICVRRIISRDNVSEEQVRVRMISQWSPDRKANLADYIIYNDEERLLIPQVLDTHSKIVGKSIDF